MTTQAQGQKKQLSMSYSTSKSAKHQHQHKRKNKYKGQAQGQAQGQGQGQAQGEAEGCVTAWINRANHGFGFIEVPGSDSVYVTSYFVVGADRLHVGQRVRYNLSRDGRGRIQAVNVRVIAGDVRASWQLR